MNPMEQPANQPPPADIRPLEEPQAAIRNNTRAAIEQMNIPAHPELLFAVPVPTELLSVRSALDAPRFQSAVKGLSALRHMSPRLEYGTAGLTLTVEGKVRGTISKDVLQSGAWEGDLLQVLRAPLGGIDRPFEELRRLQDIDGAETRRGLLSNALQLPALKQADPVGAQRLLAELQALVGADKPIDVNAVNANTMLVYENGNPEPAAVLVTGKSGVLDARQQQITRNALQYAVFRPRLDELPNAALAVHFARNLGIDMNAAKNLRAVKHDKGYSLEFIDNTGSARTIALEHRPEQR